MVTAKPCFKCGEVKPLFEFYKHSKMKDGHLNKCKECAKKDTQQNRSDRPDYYRAYDRNRPNMSERALRNKEWQDTPEGQLSRKIARGKWKSKNPIKRACEQAVNNAVRDGRLEKLPCLVCGSLAVEAHHPYYDLDNPLDVVWLCVKHHKECHRVYDKEMDLIILESYKSSLNSLSDVM